MDCSNEDLEFERLNQELLEKRRLNKLNTQNENTIINVVESAFKMPELRKNKQYNTIQQKQDITPKINAMIPKRYSDKYFSSYVGRDEIKNELIAKAKLGKSLIISGSVGTGKTHLAICYARVLIKSIFEKSDIYLKFKITTIAEMLSSIIDKTNTIDDFKKADVLLVDDLGAESSKEWTNDKIFELVNYRYMHDMLTIYTTNLSSDDLKKHIGVRTVSRIVESCEMYNLIGEDYRLKRK